MNEPLLNPRRAYRAGKTTQNAQAFLRVMESGKRAIWIGQDVVAMPRKQYDELDAALARVRQERDEARKYGEEMYAREKARHEDTFCAYCGEKYPKGTPLHGGGEALTAHIRVCEKHPMRELEARCARLIEAIDTAMHELGVPQPEYPAPVTNAYHVLQTALTTTPARPR